MNDIPEELVLVAERLNRALVADGDAIERDARARLAAAPPPVGVGETVEVGPSLDVDIDANNATPRRHSRGRLAFAIAAVVIVSLAVVVSVSRRDNGTVVTGRGEVRYLLPATLPDGYALTGAYLGFPPDLHPSGGQWRRVYTQRDGGVLGRMLVIDSVMPVASVDPPTAGQPIVVGGRSAVFASSDQGIYGWIKDDFGCGFVTVAAIGYGTATTPPSDLLDELESIECAPTAGGSSAAAITVPRGFTLEVDYDVINEAPPAWRLSYSDPSSKLSPLGFVFGMSRPAPDLVVKLTGGRANRIKRNGRDYWTATPLPATSNRGAYVAWNDGAYLVSLGSAELTLDDLLAVADSVREVDKGTFDDAIRDVTIESSPTTR